MQRALMGEQEILLCDPRWDGKREELKAWDKEGLFSCPYCGLPLTLVWGTVRFRHFRHPSGNLCMISKNEPETREHILGKMRLYEQAVRWFPQALRIEMEYRLPNGERIADVYVEDRDGRAYVFEYQRARIPEKEFLERRASYRQMGVCDIWVFGENLLQNKGHQRDRNGKKTPVEWFSFDGMIRAALDPAPFEWIYAALVREEFGKYTEILGSLSFYDPNEDCFTLLRGVFPREGSSVIYGAYRSWSASFMHIDWNDGLILKDDRQFLQENREHARMLLEKQKNMRDQEETARQQQSRLHQQALAAPEQVWCERVDERYGYDPFHRYAASRQLAIQMERVRAFKCHPDSIPVARSIWESLRKEVSVEKIWSPFFNLPVANDIVFQVPRFIWQMLLYVRLIHERSGKSFSFRQVQELLRDSGIVYALDIGFKITLTASARRLAEKNRNSIRRYVHPEHYVLLDYLDVLCFLGVLQKKASTYQDGYWKYRVVRDHMPVLQKKELEHARALVLIGRANPQKPLWDPVLDQPIGNYVEMFGSVNGG
jgi:hypothetical protein